MNAENFSEIINDPSRLFQFSYEELKSLVLENPYSSNLRQLLLIKSKLEKHPDYQKNLRMTATYSPDRTFLSQYLEKLDQLVVKAPKVSREEDFLELKDLQSLRHTVELDLDAAESEVAQQAAQMEAPLDTSAVRQPIVETPSLDDLDEDEIEENEGTIEEVNPPAKTTEENNALPQEQIQAISSQTTQTILGNLPKQTDAIYIPEHDELITAPQVESDEQPERATDDSIPLPSETLPETLDGILENEEAQKSVEGGSDVDRSKQEFDSINAQLDAELEKLLEEEEDNYEELNTLAAAVPFIPPASLREIPTTNAEEEMEDNEDEPDHLAEAHRATTDAEAVTPISVPLPQKEFKSWKQRYRRKTFSWEPQASERQTLTEEQPSEDLPVKEKSANPAKLAARSVALNDEIASETLAHLLEQQGHLARAKRMYQRLSLLFPEKSAFFAGKISEIENRKG